jgi:protein-disulfide isomerase
MVECEFCGEEFDSEIDLHLHWGEEHGDELNSHQEEKVKKAEREKESERESMKAWRRKIAIRGIVGLVAVGLALVFAQQLMAQPSGSQTADFQLESQPALTQAYLNGEATADPNRTSGNDTVTIVEFGDYRCPYCGEFANNIKPRIVENYVETGQAEFHFINFDILGPGSTKAAVADECVYREDPGNYWEFHDALYANQGPESEEWVTDDLISRLVEENTNASSEEILSCVSGQQTMSEVQRDKNIALENELTGTPQLFVNGEQVSNPTSWSVVQASIEDELE